jgi:hypothetical protein
MKSKYITLARIKLALYEANETSAKDFAFLNFIVTKDKTSKGFRIKSLLQLKIQLEDRTILQTIIKKHDFKKMFDLLELTAKKFDNKGSKFQLLNFSLFEALKQVKSNKESKEKSIKKHVKKEKKKKINA